jgi:hypothetical protein
MHRQELEVDRSRTLAEIIAELRSRSLGRLPVGLSFRARLLLIRLLLLTFNVEPAQSLPVVRPVFLDRFTALGAPNHRHTAIATHMPRAVFARGVR